MTRRVGARGECVEQPCHERLALLDVGDDVRIDTGLAGSARDDRLVDQREPEPLGDVRGDLAHVGPVRAEKQTTRQLMQRSYGSRDNGSSRVGAGRLARGAEPQ